MPDAGLVTGLFPPQDRDWALPEKVPLTTMAAERLAREAAQQPFDPAARALGMDWNTQLDGTQVQRWSEALGNAVVATRTGELAAQAQGILPDAPLNPPSLLVIGMDGGRVQGRQKDEKSQSRWREDKVASFTSYLPGDGGETPPRPLVTTYVATMGNAAEFGPMVELEARRRGQAQAEVVLNISDGGNWIDPVAAKHKLADVRIIDFHHASEHLDAVAKAVHGRDSSQAPVLWEHLRGLLYEGKVQQVITEIKAESQRLGPPAASDGPEHPRRVLQQNQGYFEKHKEHMQYDVYRKKGWPIGSGNTEAGVKGFNKRVKGTDQFWNIPGVESILALRAMWMSQDQRWERYWANRPSLGRCRAA